MILRCVGLGSIELRSLCGQKHIDKKPQSQHSKVCCCLFMACGRTASLNPKPIFRLEGVNVQGACPGSRSQDLAGLRFRKFRV